MKKRILCLFLCAAMLLCVSGQVFGVEPGSKEQMIIYHIDCGRKFFSPEDICAIIDILAANDYSHLQLAFGNNGLRFLLDDMSVAVTGATYSSEDVSAAVRAGNAAYTDKSHGELTQSEMDAIIDYAADKKVDIIPMLNSPGHMNALLYAIEALTGEECSYMGSASTIDLQNQRAVAFTQALLAKYAEYFSSKGCEFFNMGTDEYANDVFNTGSMGFGHIIGKGIYDDYVDYVNSTSALVKSYGMRPMAFNDGIYFADTLSNDGRELHVDTDILVCYWQSGWGGYTTRSAADLASDGFEIINTNDDWYYVLGRREGGFGLDFAMRGVRQTAFDAVAGDRGGALAPVGAMLCLWCDDPGAEYDGSEFENIKSMLKSFALCNRSVFPVAAPALEKERHTAYISGYPDGSIRPRGSITRAETASIFYRLLTDESRERFYSADNSFSDVDGEVWYNTAVSTLANAGIIAGYEDGLFRPDAPVTRAEFAAIISRFADGTEVKTCSFNDVSPEHWAAQAVAVAESLGWMGGYGDGSFRPGKDISRAEAVAVINRMLERAVREADMLSGMNGWPDNPPGTWYYADLQEAGSSHDYERSDEPVDGRSYCYEKWTAI